MSDKIYKRLSLKNRLYIIRKPESRFIETLKINKRAHRALIRSPECHYLQPPSVISIIQCNILYSKRLSFSLHRTLYALKDCYPRNISADFQNLASRFRRKAYLSLIGLCKTTEPQDRAIFDPGI